MTTNQEWADNFHKHLDVCAQCRNHPFALCPVGHELLTGQKQERRPVHPTVQAMIALFGAAARPDGKFKFVCQRCAQALPLSRIVDANPRGFICEGCATPKEQEVVNVS